MNLPLSEWRGQEPFATELVVEKYIIIRKKYTPSGVILDMLGVVLFGCVVFKRLSAHEETLPDS